MRPGEENRATGRIAVNKGLLPYPFGQGGTEIEWPTVCALVVGRLDFCGIRGGGTIELTAERISGVSVQVDNKGFC